MLPFFLSDTAKHIVPVLQNVTLNIPKEKATAIVGSTSGAGKSTIISLLDFMISILVRFHMKDCHRFLLLHIFPRINTINELFKLFYYYVTLLHY